MALEPTFLLAWLFAALVAASFAYAVSVAWDARTRSHRLEAALERETEKRQRLARDLAALGRVVDRVAQASRTKTPTLALVPPPTTPLVPRPPADTEPEPDSGEPERGPTGSTYVGLGPFARSGGVP